MGLLTFRSLCKEIYEKEDKKLLHEKVLTFLKANDNNKYVEISLSLNPYLAGIDMALSETYDLKKKLDTCILENNFDEINFTSIHTNVFTEIMLSGAVAPEFDLHGNRLNNLEFPLNINDYIAVNIFASENEGRILFSWYGKNIKNEQFVNSLMEPQNNEFSNRVFKMAFEYFENTFISQKFWNLLSMGKKKKIQKKVMSFPGNRDAYCFTSDNTKYVKPWKINKVIESYH